MVPGIVQLGFVSFQTIFLQEAIMDFSYLSLFFEVDFTDTSKKKIF